jgi:hypothetical protein
MTKQQKEVTMPIQRIEVIDDYALGQLFIDWARDPAKWPKDLDAFKQQTVNTGVLSELPEYIKALMIVQSGKEVLLLRLPPKELVEDTLNSIGNPSAYELRPFYKEFVCDGLHTKDKFFRFRVGDYTIAHCQ